MVFGSVGCERLAANADRAPKAKSNLGPDGYELSTRPPPVGLAGFRLGGSENDAIAECTRGGGKYERYAESVLSGRPYLVCENTFDNVLGPGASTWVEYCERRVCVICNARDTTFESGDDYRAVAAAVIAKLHEKYGPPRSFNQTKDIYRCPPPQVQPMKPGAPLEAECEWRFSNSTILRLRATQGDVYEGSLSEVKITVLNKAAAEAEAAEKEVYRARREAEY